MLPPVLRSRRPIRFAVAATLLAGTVVAADPLVRDASSADATIFRQQTIAAAGPLGPIAVFGDSVMLGSGINQPTIADRLAQQGWGPVRYVAGGGYNTGAHGGSNPSVAPAYWFSLWRSQGFETRDVLINLGANDAGFCTTNLACARRSILHVVDGLGPGHRVWWPMITHERHRRAWQDTWNLALTQIAAERPDVFTWDWPTVMAGGGFPSHDNIHLSPDGYRRRSELMAQVLTDDLARSRRVGGDAPLPVPTGALPATFVPIPPVRVLDSRSGAPGRLAAGQRVAVDVGARLPTGSTAVAVNLTAVGPSSSGFLTADSCGVRRDVSSVNYRTGADRAAMAVLPLSRDGTICVYTSHATDLLVDVQGAFVTGGSTDSAGLTPTDPPLRLLDTRPDRRAPELSVASPAGAAAIAVTLTTTDASNVGFLTAYPCGGSIPEVSNVNFRPGETIAGAAFVPVGPDGRVCVATSAAVDVIVDLTGTFRSGDGLRFVPATPTRVLDTRSAVGGWAPLHGRGDTLDVRVAPPEARAVTGTVTLVGLSAAGWVRAAPCGATPPTSNVNGVPADASANAVTSSVSAGGRLCLYSSDRAHSLFDTTGWWIP